MEACPLQNASDCNLEYALDGNLFDNHRARPSRLEAEG